MAFKPDDRPASGTTDVPISTLQENAHHYQVKSLEAFNPASVRGNEKYLPTVHLDDKQGEDKVGQKYGVEVKANGSKYEYHQKENGQDKVVFSTDANPDGLKQGEKKLNELVLAKEKELEAKYPGLTFAHDGDDLGKQHLKNDPKGQAHGESVKARNPTLKELAGVEAALSHSDPAYKGGSLRIQFTDTPLIEAQKKGDYASYVPPDSKQPGSIATINVDKRSGTQNATEKDVTRKEGDRDSIETVITHELAHATQFHVDGLVKDARFKRETGWVPLKHPPEGMSDYALKGKDGYLYQPVPRDNSDVVDWVKMQPNAGYDAEGKYKGAYIGKDGKPITTDFKTAQEVLDNTTHIDNLQMINLAKIKPITRYFDNPNEMMAEALADYRTNATSREHLRQESPKLYKAAKHLDQLELDKIYGKGKRRQADGTVGDAH